MQIGLSLSLTAQLRLSTSAYVVSGFEPALVFDFKNSYYRKGEESTVFASAITHAASTNATMVDSDGLLKWRPHNTLSYSEDLTNSNWVKQVSATVDLNVAAAPDGSMTASRLTFGGSFSNLRQIGAAVTGATATTKVWIKLESGNANLAFGISAAQFDILNVTSEWVEYSTTDTEVASNGKGFLLQDRNSSGFGSVLIWHPHSFRSDLGGMVNNPDASTGLESYVPTTTTPVYLSRRGHHIYNGSAWVNEGILHESEARTNLLLNSGTLSTQSATVANVANTLSFTGTGTVTLSGVSTAGPLVGTGTGENNRVSLTFTPTAGTLTLTVSGTVTNAQLEQGATPSSYIPTGSATVTRAAETLTVPAANLPYDSTNMSIQMDGKMTYADTGSEFNVTQYRWQSSGTNYIQARVRTHGTRTGQPFFAQRQSTSGYDEVTGGDSTYSPDTNVPFNIASRHGTTFINGAHESTLLTANTTPTILPALSTTDLNLGSTFMGTIGQFRMWDEDITDAGITEAST